MALGLNKKGLLDKSVDVMIYIFMLVVVFLTLYPFWYCVVGSLNQGMDYIKGGVNFWPRKFTLANYAVVLKNTDIVGAFKVTVLRTIIGTITHLLFTSIFAYGYSRKILKLKKFYMYVGLIPMYFSGGLIPQYILYKELHLLDSFLVYIIPSLLSFWHVIIIQSFFRGLPDSLSESAMIDGANEYRIYWSIIMPLSTPVLAVIALFTGVAHWNAYFDSMVYTTSKSLQTVQVYLMKLIKTRELAATMALDSASVFDREEMVTSETIQLATMVTVTLPILLIYPFLQRYFVKGMLIGSIKG